MTDEQGSTGQHSMYAEAARYQMPDHVLMALVNGANTYGMGISVTLHVSGEVISGTMISGAEFSEQLAEALRQTQPSPNMPEGAEHAGGILATVFDSLAKEYRDQAEVERASGLSDEGTSPIVYIHLRDAAVHAPGGRPLPGMLWRGRLSHVSGWSIGTLA